MFGDGRRANCVTSRQDEGPHGVTSSQAVHPPPLPSSSTSPTTTNPLQLRLVPLYGATSSEMRVQDQNGQPSGSSHTQFTLPGVRRTQWGGRGGGLRLPQLFSVSFSFIIQEWLTKSSWSSLHSFPINYFLLKVVTALQMLDIDQ